MRNLFGQGRHPNAEAIEAAVLAAPGRDQHPPRRTRRRLPARPSRSRSRPPWRPARPNTPAQRGRAAQRVAARGRRRARVAGSGRRDGHRHRRAPASPATPGSRPTRGSGTDLMDESEQVEVRLREAGWAAHTSIAGELRTWTRLATEVDEYQMTIDGYAHDVCSRDYLPSRGRRVGWHRRHFALIYSHNSTQPIVPFATPRSTTEMLGLGTTTGLNTSPRASQRAFCVRRACPCASNAAAFDDRDPTSLSGQDR